MFSKWVIASGLALVLTGLIVDMSSAQEKKRRGGGGLFSRGSLVRLSTNEAVQNDIGINDEAKTKLTALAEKHSAESQEQLQGLFAGGFQNATSEERQKATEKMAEVTRSLNAKYTPSLKEILKPEQFTRLQQINLQSLGGQALAEPDVVKELAITKEQQEKIATVNSDYQKKQGELFRDGAGGNFQEAAAKMRELSQQRDKMANDVLTKEQQEKFTQLKGKTFDVSQLGFGGRRQNNN